MQKSDFDELLKKVKKDGTLKKSELKNFLDEICDDSKAFDKFKAIVGRTRFETLDELKEEYLKSKTK